MNQFICFYLIVIVSLVVLACKDDSTEASEIFVDSNDNHRNKWVKIGDRIWMAENLAFLPVIYPPTVGDANKAYCYVYGYDANEAKSTEKFKILSVLYNREAALTASPKGWYLPSDEE